MIIRPDNMKIVVNGLVLVIDCHPEGELEKPSGPCWCGFPQAKTGLGRAGQKCYKVFVLKLNVNYYIGSLWCRG
jgi:hypothetical protein